MSHSRERKEYDCLNCGTIVQGRYCHVCGQENIDTKDSFWGLVKHFVFDILHFDGKFWLTLRRLFTIPGGVAKDYVDGKRMPYVHPIRMYLFTSAVFFLIFFASDPVKVHSDRKPGNITAAGRKSYMKMYESRMAMVPADSFLRSRIALLRDTAVPINPDSLGWNSRGQRLVSYDGKYYRSFAEFDSLEKTLPDNKREGWISRVLTKRQLRLGEEYERDEDAMRAILNLFVHRIPYLLFISLPFFAGILKLLYRRRKQFAYSDHAVFTLYHYVLSFLLLGVTMLNSKLHDSTKFSALGFLQAVLVIGWMLYLFLEMKRFYGQGIGKTLAKFTLLGLAASILIMMLFTFLVILTIFI